MQSLVSMNITAVRQSDVLFVKNYGVVFGEGMVKSDLPTRMKCKLEQIAAFPSLELASSIDDQGSRLIDILSFLQSANLPTMMQTAGFTINEDIRSVNVWVRAETYNVLVSTPQVTTSVEESQYCDIDSREDEVDKIGPALKEDVKMLVRETFPRDESGSYLTDSAKDPTLRRPKWVMNELFRRMSSNYNAHESKLATKFAIRFIRRERLKQGIILSGGGTQANRETFEHEVAAWNDGPYGKAWKGGMKERPPPRMLLEQLSKSKTTCETTINRYLYVSFFYIIN